MDTSTPEVEKGRMGGTQQRRGGGITGEKHPAVIP